MERIKPMMGFGEAVKIVFSKYATFTGRARRSEYWFFVLFYCIVIVIASILDTLLDLDFSTDISFGPIYSLVLLAMIVPSLAVLFRRLHDVDRSGWWVLISLVPFIGSLVLLVFCCFDSQKGTNKYGPSPKYLEEDTPEVDSI